MQKHCTPEYDNAVIDSSHEFIWQLNFCFVRILFGKSSFFHKDFV